MEKETSEEKFKKIQEIIFHEEEEALRNFRSVDFENQLNKSILDLAAGKKPFRFSRAIPAPTIGIFLILILAGLFAFLTIGKKTSTDYEWASFQEFFEQALALKESRPSAERALKGPEALSPIGGTVEKALSVLSEEQKLSRPWEELHPPFEKKDTPKLDLRKKIEILIKEKSIERFLSFYSEKFKEV